MELKKKSLKYVTENGLGNYYAGNDGNIYAQGDKRLPVYQDGSVYVQDDAGVKQRIRAHWLIAVAFVKNPDDYEFVGFKDGNKRNRKPENLEWMANKNGGGIYKKQGSKKSDAIWKLLDGGWGTTRISEELQVSKQYVQKVKLKWIEEQSKH